MNNDSELSIVVRARNEASRVLNEVNRDAKSLGGGMSDSFEKAKLGSGILLGSVTALGVGVGATLTKFVGMGGFSRALNIEDAQAKLRGLGHDAAAVTGIMESALASVKGTAYALDEAATTAATAVAAGVKPGQDLTRYLKLTADAATIAGTSMADMGSVFNKVQTVNAAYNDSLLQLAEKGIPIYQWLSKELGVSAESVKKLASEGNISAEKFRLAVEKNISGAALESGNTVRGSWANLQAAMARVGAAIADDILPRVRNALQGLTVWFDANSPRIVAAIGWIGETIVKIFGEAEPYIPALAGALMVALVPALYAVAAGVWATLAPLLPFIAAGAALGLAVNALAQSMGGWSVLWDYLKNAIMGVYNAVAPVLLPALQALWSTIVNDLWPAIQNLWNTISPILIPVLKTLGIIVGAYLVAQIWLAINVLKIIIQYISWFANTLASGINWVINFGTSVVGWFSRLPGNIASALGTIRNVITSPFEAAYNWLKGLPQKMVNLFTGIGGMIRRVIGDIDIPGPLGKIKDVIPGFATGVSNFAGGLAVVGERGPELVAMPRGSSVYPADETRRMLGGAGGFTFNNYGTIVNETPQAANAFWSNVDEQARLAELGVPT